MLFRSTFYKTSLDGYLAKEKGGVSAERIKTDDAFIRTRENGSEFGRAGHAGKLLRVSIHDILNNGHDQRVTSRLTQAMVKVIHADTTNARGARTVVDGDVTLLQGFDFNIKAKLGATMNAPYTDVLDRVAGTASVNIPSFVPIDMLRAPEGTTHFKIVSAGTEIDFATGTYNTDAQETAILPWDSTATALINQVLTLTAGSV